MSKRYDQSEARPFKSLYKEGYITAPNYLCELIFQRRGEYDKNAVPQELWLNKKFKGQYVGQLININKLLKTYSISTLISAFKESKALSVTNPAYIKIVERIHLAKTDKEKVIEKSKVEFNKPREAFGKKNKLGDL
jgi:hypothetical protein